MKKRDSRFSLGSFVVMFLLCLTISVAVCSILFNRADRELKNYKEWLADAEASCEYYQEESESWYKDFETVKNIFNDHLERESLGFVDLNSKDKYYHKVAVIYLCDNINNYRMMNPQIRTKEHLKKLGWTACPCCEENYRKYYSDSEE